MILWPWLILVTVVGACVGSFLNVVIYRLPEGRSIVHPPSACPRCGARLAWHDNVPVLGWLWLRGRCRYCKDPISVQYPLVEALTAMLFGGWFAVCYVTDLRPDFAGPGFFDTWLILAVYLALLAALLAATVIDARFFIIPLEIPWLVTAIALILLPLAVWLFPGSVVEVPLPPAVQDSGRLLASERLRQVPEPYRHAAAVHLAVLRGEEGPVEVSAAPLTSRRVAWMALGGAGGLVLALALLRFGLLPQSFSDAEHHQPKDEDAASQPDGERAAESAGPEDPHAWSAHPYPRREVLKECLFLLLPVAGGIIGWMLAASHQPGGPPASDGGGGLVFRTLGGALLGYLAGGGIVWATRILGTLGFGKEAMGLGDVHLLAAVGAVCGWQVTVAAFFLAPFLGLSWALLAVGAARLLRREVRIIPYGPHLAVATLVVIIIREPVLIFFGIMLWR